MLDSGAAATHADRVDVVPLPLDTSWLRDARDDERALRVSWHHEVGRLVLSTWRDGRCTGTVQLDPADAARLVGVLADGLAEGAAAVHRSATG